MRIFASPQTVSLTVVGGNEFISRLEPSEIAASVEFNNWSEGMQFYDDYDMIINNVNKIGIPLLDMHKLVFSKHNDPFSLFPFRKYGHYNSEGYKIIADKIYEKISED